MMVKLSETAIAGLGCKNAAEANAAIEQLLSESQTLKNSMSETTANFEAITKRIEALEKGIVTDARISELVSTGANLAISSWAASEAGKATMGAEASRITVAALAAIGTTPAKSSPVPIVQETKTFASIVQNGMSAGKTKSASILAAIESHPKEYQEYLKTGGNL